MRNQQPHKEYFRAAKKLGVIICVPKYDKNHGANEDAEIPLVVKDLEKAKFFFGELGVSNDNLSICYDHDASG